jgi:opacity protein-like surface antigen
MIQRVAALFSILLVMGLATPAQADERSTPSTSGFYGGVSLRERAQDGPGLTIGAASSVWSRYATPTLEDTSQRTLVFGGYRFSNDIAVEASFNAIDKYALKPAEPFAAARGVGLSFGSGNGFGDAPNRAWNLDVYTSWNFYRNFALYGRVGYAQSDAPREIGAVSVLTPEVRRTARDGVNYGLGVRYDMNSALGLRLEYGRFGRFAGEMGAGLLPESDQVTFGVQFRF